MERAKLGGALLKRRVLYSKDSGGLEVDPWKHKFTVTLPVEGGTTCDGWHIRTLFRGGVVVSFEPYNQIFTMWSLHASAAEKLT